MIMKQYEEMGMIKIPCVRPIDPKNRMNYTPQQRARMTLDDWEIEAGCGAFYIFDEFVDVNGQVQLRCNGCGHKIKISFTLVED